MLDEDKVAFFFITFAIDSYSAQHCDKNIMRAGESGPTLRCRSLVESFIKHYDMITRQAEISNRLDARKIEDARKDGLDE